ncbi:MAG: hypothetical protein ACREJU_06015 [Nitrospiraceae bacterium]
MRTRRSGASPFYPKIHFAFTDHPITVWAGTILLRLYFELIGLRACLTPVLAPFGKRSNNQIPAVDVLLCWFYGLALGVERFEHFTRSGSTAPPALGHPAVPLARHDLYPL